MDESEERQALGRNLFLSTRERTTLVVDSLRRGGGKSAELRGAVFPGEVAHFEVLIIKGSSLRIGWTSRAALDRSRGMRVAEGTGGDAGAAGGGGCLRIGIGFQWIHGSCPPPSIGFKMAGDTKDSWAVDRLASNFFFRRKYNHGAGEQTSGRWKRGDVIGVTADLRDAQNHRIVYSVNGMNHDVAWGPIDASLTKDGLIPTITTDDDTDCSLRINVGHFGFEVGCLALMGLG